MANQSEARGKVETHHVKKWKASSKPARYINQRKSPTGRSRGSEQKETGPIKRSKNVALGQNGGKLPDKLEGGCTNA